MKIIFNFITFTFLTIAIVNSFGDIAFQHKNLTSTNEAENTYHRLETTKPDAAEEYSHRNNNVPRSSGFNYLFSYVISDYPNQMEQNLMGKLENSEHKQTRAAKDYFSNFLNLKDNKKKTENTEIKNYSRLKNDTGENSTNALPDVSLNTSKNGGVRFGSYRSVQPLFSLFQSYFPAPTNKDNTKQSDSSRVPLYVKHRIREEVLAKPLESGNDGSSSIMEEFRDGILTQLGLKSLKKTLMRELLSNNSASKIEGISSRSERSENGEKNPERRGYIQNGRFHNSSFPDHQVTSWYVYMNCSRDQCRWTNSTNATELMDQGWVLHNCSSVGCTDLYPKTESARDFIRILLLVGSLCILKVLVFVIIFYYCRSLHTGKSQGLRSFFSREKYGKRQDRKDAEDSGEEELLYVRNFENEKFRSPQSPTKGQYRQGDFIGDGKQKKLEKDFPSDQKTDYSTFPKTTEHIHLIQSNSKIWTPPITMSPECREAFAIGDSTLISSIEDKTCRRQHKYVKCLHDQLDKDNLSVLKKHRCGVPRWKGFSLNNSDYT